ncbi:MAG: hypothetical protein AAGA54_14115 [Myxococcota bacterium]
MSSVGVVVVGHGDTASRLLHAAKGIVPTGGLDDVVALDAGVGDSDTFTARMCAALEDVDTGAGVLLLVDLLGASPCECGRREGVGRDVVTLSGLNLAMLLKLSSLDRTTSTAETIAQACAASAHKAVHVTVVPKTPPT